MEGYLGYIVGIAAGVGGGPLQPVYRINGDRALGERDRRSRCPATAAWGRCASATTPTGRCSTTSTARRSSPSTHVFFDERLVQRGDAVLFERLEALGRRAIAVFDQPDAGLWELRGSAARAHVLERDVLGGVRPAGAHRGAPRPRRARGARGAPMPSASTRFVDERCWSEARQRFVAHRRRRRARREPAAARRARLRRAGRSALRADRRRDRAAS